MKKSKAPSRNNTLANVDDRDMLVYALEYIAGRGCQQTLGSFVSEAESNRSIAPGTIIEFKVQVEKLGASATDLAYRVTNGRCSVKEIIQVFVDFHRLREHILLPNFVMAPIWETAIRKRNATLDPLARKGNLKANPKEVIPFYKTKLAEFKQQGVSAPEKRARDEVKAKFGVGKTWIYQHIDES